MDIAYAAAGAVAMASATGTGPGAVVARNDVVHIGDFGIDQHRIRILQWRAGTQRRDAIAVSRIGCATGIVKAGGRRAKRSARRAFDTGHGAIHLIAGDLRTGGRRPRQRNRRGGARADTEIGGRGRRASDGNSAARGIAIGIGQRIIKWRR